LNRGALLPMDGNGTSLRCETVQRGSVALTVTADNENFFPDVLFEGI
jgi:hypothetical protein